MYEVYWVNTALNEETKYGSYPTLEEAEAAVTDWWKKTGFKPYHIKKWNPEDGYYTWDYGSNIFFYEFRKAGDEDDK